MFNQQVQLLGLGQPGLAPAHPLLFEKSGGNDGVSFLNGLGDQCPAGQTYNTDTQSCSGGGGSGGNWYDGINWGALALSAADIAFCIANPNAPKCAGAAAAAGYTVPPQFLAQEPWYETTAGMIGIGVGALLVGALVYTAVK